jgi:hypothetical protein
VGTHHNRGWAVRWWPSATPTGDTAIEEGRDLSSMSGILADSSYRLLAA